MLKCNETYGRMNQTIFLLVLNKEQTLTKALWKISCSQIEEKCNSDDRAVIKTLEIQMK